MRFACLGYIDEKKWNAMSKSEQEAMIEECLAYDDELLKNGHWVDGGQALQSARNAKTLRRSGDKVIVTDGPYAETKEQLGGLGVLEARDMAHAIELMSKHPGVRLGGPFEIRPVDAGMEERCTLAAAEPEAAGEGMQFACLGYGDENNWNAMSEGEREAMIDQCIAFGEMLRKHGGWVGGNALQGAGTAKTLRYQGRKVLVTDGPYAETKEQLGGIATFQFRDMDHALEAWSEHPCLRVGDILEIRPVDEAFNARWEARQKRIESATKR